MNKKKYRPYFTEEELAFTIANLKSSPNVSAIKMQIIKNLEFYALKIQHGIVSPSAVQTAESRISITEKLGYDILGRDIQYAPAQSLKQIRENHYNKYLTNPVQCTPKEIEDALIHKYENDLMTEEEANEHEAKLGINF